MGELFSRKLCMRVSDGDIVHSNTEAFCGHQQNLRLPSHVCVVALDWGDPANTSVLWWLYAGKLE